MRNSKGGESSEQLKRSIVAFYNALIANYPHIYRAGGDELAAITSRGWKVNFVDAYGIEALDWFSSNHLGKGLFEGMPPRPHHACCLWLARDDEWFNMAMKLDSLLHAHYMSLYLRDSGGRIERIKEMSALLSEIGVHHQELHAMMARIRKSADWRSYPPSLYDIRNLIIRMRSGIGSCDEEFANYLQGNKTSCVMAICAAIGRDNLRAMGMEVLSRVFKRMYYTLDEAEWRALGRLVDSIPSTEDDSEEPASRENTLALFSVTTTDTKGQ